MKIRGFILLVFIFFWNFLKAGVLPDANTLVLSKILAQGISQIQKMQRTYEKITEFTQISQQTRNQIAELLKLESETQKALRMAGNIKDLKISDIKYLLEQNLNIRGDIDNYINTNSSLNQVFHNLKNQNLDFRWGIDLYNQIHSPSLNVNADRMDQSTNVFDQMGLETYIQDQNSRMYQMMQNFADRYEEQALELESMIKADNLFSMNTSERMNLLIQAGTLLEKAINLRKEANQILLAKPGETLQAQNMTLELVKTQKDLSARINFSKDYSQVLFP